MVYVGGGIVRGIKVKSWNRGHKRAEMGRLKDNKRESGE
jgi:hypothetical protein